jgi:predicted metallopeptidase
MSVDIISNNGLSYLNQVNRKQNSSNYIYQDITDNFDYGPAYIVELSAKGRQLQQDHPVKIVRL